MLIVSRFTEKINNIYAKILSIGDGLIVTLISKKVCLLCRASACVFYAAAAKKERGKTLRLRRVPHIKPKYNISGSFSRDDNISFAQALISDSYDFRSLRCRSYARRHAHDRGESI